MSSQPATSLFPKLLLAGFLAASAVTMAAAQPRAIGLESSGPNCGVALGAPEWRNVWLGHFAGGNLVRTQARYSTLDWQDRYFCFPSQATCQSWQRSMRRAYRRVEGYRTCLLIRNGPLTPLEDVLVVRY